MPRLTKPREIQWKVPLPYGMAISLTITGNEQESDLVYLEVVADKDWSWDGDATPMNKLNIEQLMGDFEEIKTLLAPPKKRTTPANDFG